VIVIISDTRRAGKCKCRTEVAAVIAGFKGPLVGQWFGYGNERPCEKDERGRLLAAGGREVLVEGKLSLISDYRVCNATAFGASAYDRVPKIILCSPRVSARRLQLHALELTLRRLRNSGIH
jgi:hypothetical protein